MTLEVLTKSVLYSLFMLKVVKNCCDVAVSINADPVVVYKDERTELFNKIKIANGNFVFLNNIDKTR